MTLKYRPSTFPLILTLLLFTTCGFCTTVKYIFTPHFQENALDVELTFPGHDSHDYYVIPTWTGHPAPEITDIRSRVEKKRDTGKKEVIVSYRLKTLGSPSRNAEFQITPSHFRLTGNYLVVPHKIDWKKNIVIKMEWKGVPEDWVIANSFAIHEKNQTTVATLSSLQKALFVGGEFNVFRWSEEEGTPYVVVKKSDKLSGESLLPLLKEIVQSQREFWNDHHFPHSIMAIFPTSAQNPFHAQAYQNAFIAFLPPLSESECYWASISQVLSHEYFHTWVPYKMMPEVPKDFDHLTWFSEGFVDYYSTFLNYRATITSETQAVNEINRTLYEYYTSPCRNVSNAQMGSQRHSEEFSKMKLPYLRGCLFALLWDAKIQQATNGANTLDNMMLLLLQKTNETGKPYSKAMIADLAGIYLGHQTASNDLQTYITEGKTIVPPEWLFGKKTPLRWMEDVGFHLIDTKKTGYLQQVDKERAAYKAGLRNGQVFRKIHRSDHGIYHVDISERGVQRRLSFQADGKEPIPQYVLPQD